MPTLQEILQDQNYINANPATKKAIFDRWSASDTNYTGANPATQQAIRSRFGVGGVDVALPAEPPAEKSGFLRQVADVPLGIGKGAATGVRMIADAFGAGSGASEAIKGVEGYLSGLMSAQAKNDEKEVARIMKDAEDKGVLDQVKAGFKAFSVAPIDLLSQGFGTAAAPVIGMLGGKLLGAGALGMSAIGTGIGAGMGAGSAKGGIYEEVKAALKEAKVDDAKAEQVALEAQKYGGKNMDQILLSAGLGGLAGRFGLESSAKRMLTGAVGKEAGKSAAREMAEGAARTAVTESVPELLQGSQEQVAKNIALQREGFDVPTMRGVAGSGTLEALAGAGLGAVSGGTEAGLRRQARGEADRILAEEQKVAADAEQARLDAEAAKKAEGTKAIEDQAAEVERQQQQQQQRQQAAMDRARAGGIGGGSEVNQTMLEQARIRKEQQDRAAAAEEKAAEAERQRALRAERVRIGGIQYSGDPMMNEVLRSRAITDFDAANAPKAEAPKPAPEYQPTKTIEQTTPIEQPKDFNVLRGVDARNADLMSAVAERRAAQEKAAATQAKTTEAKKVEEAAKVDTSRADVDQRVAQVENFLMSPARKTQQETADYMAGVVPEMQRDFMALFDEDMNQPLTPEQTEALKAQIRQRLQPDFIPDENVQRTPFKRFLAAKGMNKKDVQDIFGENAYRANQQLPGAIKADGPRLDMLAEAAVEAGFLQNEDTEALVDMIKAEFGGDEQVSVDMSGDRAAAEYEAQRESELESRAAVIGLKTKGMTPDQIAARLDRIERKREEKRRQYSRSVDGFADLPTAEQDRIIDMMIDQFGEPQVFDVERAEIEGRVREEEELLQTQSEKQLRDKQTEIDRLAKENERLSKEAERKAKADEEAGDFTLTGSDRVADKAAARGQMDLTEDEKPTREEVLSGVKALAEKLLSKGAVKYEDTELGGDVYQVITRTFEGKLFGSELRTVREALGNATEVTLVNDEDQVMTLSLPGRNVGEGANVRVMDSKYVPEDRVEDQTEDLRTTEELKSAMAALNKRMSSTLTSKGNMPAKGSKGYEAYQALKKERDNLVKKYDKAEAREKADSDSQKGMRSAEDGRGYNISAEDQRIEKELTGKSMIQAADWAVANAPNAFAKVIAEKVRNRLREFQRKGMTLEFNIVGGSTRPMVLSGARGITKPEWGKDDKGSKFTVTLNGAAVMDNQAGYPPGVQYNTILHELLHVATRSQFVFMPNTDPLKKQMAELFDLVVTRFNADAKAGTLPPVMVKYYKRMNNVLEDPDELLTWGLTDKDVQAYFDDIKVGEKSVFTRLVELIRTALGLGKPYESALERLVRTSESMLDVDVDAIDAMLGQRDKQIGVKKKPAGPMTQESLFQKEGEPAAMREGRGPKTINVDGKERPTTNSDGQSIADTDEALRNFWRWFGNSKVIDKNGRPLVVYHGTDKRFNEFKPQKGLRGNALTGNLREVTPKVFYFTPDENYAKSYGETKNSVKNYLMPVYLKADYLNTMTSFADVEEYTTDTEQQFENEEKQFWQYLEDPEFLEKYKEDWTGAKFESYDGVEYAVFDPAQIKSATGNIGTYDPKSADIRYQRETEAEPAKTNPTRQNIFGEPVLGTWSITVDPKMELQDGLIYKMLDKNIDVKRIVEAVKSTGKEIASKWNPYLQEELYHGRTANASQEFQDKEWLPLLQDMDKKGVTIGELEKYLLNRHAEEYNKLVAKRNPNRPEMQDGGSSVTTEAAREYLAGLDKETKAKYDELAKRIDGITKGTRQLLVDTGYEKAKTVAGWEKAFPNYVPLMREEANFDYNFGSFGTGRGFDVRRDFSRSAMGSKRNVVDIIGNVISARNNAIALTEKNRVAQAVYGLAVDAPNPDFWMAINPDAEKIPEDAIDELRAMGLDEEAVEHLMKEPKQRVLDPKRDEIVSRVNTKLRENDYVLATRINGEKRYVFFNPKDPRSKRAATALKNLDAQDLGTALGLIAKVTRWMASVNTQYNPIFGPYNFLRDVQSAALQLSTTELAGQQKEIAENVVPSLRAIYSSLRSRRKGEKVEGEMADLWKEFQKEGGQTGFKDNFSRTQDRTEALLNEMEKITEGKVKANARAVFDWLSDYNDSLENAVRLSAYKAAKEKFAGEGFSDSEVKQKAASLAKNLTVNFNRKGDIATQMGALYAFFNASMQGTARMIETLKGPTGKKIIAGGLLLGGMQAALLAAAGFDDDEPPEFIRSKNIVIPTGDGDYVAFPMPLGFHVIPGVSRILTEWTLSGFKDTARRTTDLTGLFLDAFNPIGNAGWSVQTITPTILDPLVALGENKDWTGKPISKEDLFSLRPTPGYTRAREGANILSTNLAEFLNLASGGTKHQPGVLSPTPEQIEYLVGQAFGGVGREAMKLATTIEKTTTGEELPPYKIPLYGRFVGETKSSAAESNKFYKNMERLNRLDLEIKGRREDKEPIGDFMKDNPEARLLPMANKTYKEVQALRKRRAALVERDAPKESVQAVEKMITRKMQALNERVKAMDSN